MAQQHVVVGGSAVIVAVQLTDPLSGATCVLIRGAARGSRARLVTDLKQQVQLNSVLLTLLWDRDHLRNTTFTVSLSSQYCKQHRAGHNSVSGVHHEAEQSN